MKIRAVFLIITLVVIFSLMAFVFDFYRYTNSPSGPDDTGKVVEIGSGQSSPVILKNLYQAGIINDIFKFKLLIKAKRLSGKIKAGEYLLSASMSPNQVLDIIVSGKVFLHKLTVPEGYTIFQIADVVEKTGLGTRADFLRAATDADFVYETGIEAQTFEGYLFPDTYYFPKRVSPRKIISAMVSRFRVVFTPGWESRAKELGLTVHQVVTLASIIEKETGAAFERPVISSVFHNRLKKNMRLDSDPTVIYGIKGFDGNITREHLMTATPYNTYKIKGLPPGPIANPGLKAIEAALYPPETNYLYFVAKKDKTHKFSTNIIDHNRAVREYQLRR